MLKYLEDNTWGIVKNDEIIIQAKFWHYPNCPENHCFHKTGLIGNFKCSEKVSLEESFMLFEHLENTLQSSGCTKIIGPIDGNTWQNYRLTTYYGTQRNFMLEPYTPEYFIKHWEYFGFEPEETYSSYITSVIDWTDKRIIKLQEKFQNLSFRKLEEKDLSPVFDLSLKSFVKNPYYVHIEKEVYLGKYGKMIALLNPNLSWVVYDKEELVGYIFAILNQNGVYNPNDSVILKTAAINDSKKYAGLGVYLLSKLIEESKSLQIDYVIHALMHDKNPVQNIVKSTGEKMRGYTLYKKDII